MDTAKYKPFDPSTYQPGKKVFINFEQLKSHNLGGLFHSDRIIHILNNTEQRIKEVYLKYPTGPVAKVVGRNHWLSCLCMFEEIK